jgi:hydroxymethylbilane synthase
VGDKSRWTGAIEQALVAGEIDLAVHSAKDVPGELAPARRSSPSRRGRTRATCWWARRPWPALRAGARVGTSALRRRAQLLAVRPDLEVVELRGNVDTRLRKLAAGEVDALVLAAAGCAARARRRGVRRAGGRGVRARAGQGCLAVQAHARPAVRRGVRSDAVAAPAGGAGASSRGSDASCHTPVGVHADAASCARSPACRTGRSGCRRGGRPDALASAARRARLLARRRRGGAARRCSRGAERRWRP